MMIASANIVARLSHNTMLSLLVLMLFLPVITGSFIHSISQQIEVEHTQLANEMKRSLALLARSAERLITKEPALLKEHFSQVISDARVKNGAIIDAHGRVWHGAHQEWRQRDIDEILANETVKFITSAANTRRLVALTSTEQPNIKIFAMSFSAPAPDDIGQQARGVIFFSCDLTVIKKSAINRALYGASIEVIVLTTMAGVLWAIMRVVVSMPLRKIQQIAKSPIVSTNETISIHRAPKELIEVADAINSMRQEILQQLAKEKEESEFTNLILDNTDDGFIIIDCKGCILLVSQPITQIFGFTAHELIGNNISMLMPSPHRDIHDNFLQAYLTTGKKGLIGMRREVFGLRKNGDMFKLELRVQEFIKEGERFYVGSIRDISEKDALEKAKTEFVSTVSHELRTPLTSILGAIELILGTASDQIPSQVNNLLQISKRNGERLLSLIKDLLDMEKLMTGNFKLNTTRQSATPLVSSGVDLLRNYGQEKHIEIQFDSTTHSDINIDVDRFNQIIANLLSNAIKFSPPESSVRVLVNEENDRVKITVSDQGPGIPDSFRDKIFHKFAQADSSDSRQKGGTGLGLAITKELIELMNGTIDFHSESGKGTTFTVEFPIA